MMVRFAKLRSTFPTFVAISPQSDQVFKIRSRLAKQAFLPG